MEKDLIWQRLTKHRKTLNSRKGTEKKLRRIGEIRKERGGIDNCTFDEAIEIYNKEKKNESSNIS